MKAHISKYYPYYLVVLINVIVYVPLCWYFWEYASVILKFILLGLFIIVALSIFVAIIKSLMYFVSKLITMDW